MWTFKISLDIDIKKGNQELGWDKGKEWMQEVAVDFSNLLIAIQRFKYMVKFDAQHLFHKKNRSNESFLKVSELFDKIIKSYSKNELKDYFRDQLINKKNPAQANYQKLCSHSLERTENPALIFFKCTAVLELACMKLTDFSNDHFQSRQFSLIKNSIQSIKKNKIAIVVAGRSHFVKNNKLEFNVEQYFSSQKVPHLILAPIFMSYAEGRTLDKVTEMTSDIPENMDFSVRTKKGFYSFVSVCKMAAIRYQKLATLIGNHYRSDGSTIPSDHPKHKTPGPHPKGPIQHNKELR